MVLKTDSPSEPVPLQVVDAYRSTSATKLPPPKPGTTLCDGMPRPSPIVISSAMDQTVVVSACGDDASGFFVDNIPVLAKKIGARDIIDYPGAAAAAPAGGGPSAVPKTYLVLLSGTTLRNLAKARSLAARDDLEPSLIRVRAPTRRPDRIAILTAVNPAGIATTQVPLQLAFDALYPAEQPPSRFRLKRDPKTGKVTEYERAGNDIWPAEAFEPPPEKKK